MLIMSIFLTGSASSYLIDNTNTNMEITNQNPVINPVVIDWRETVVHTNFSNLFSLESDIVIDSLGNVHLVWAEKEDILGSGTDIDYISKMVKVI